MKVNEFSKSAPAPGFFARLFGKTVNSYALTIVFGAQSVDKVDAEITSAKAAIKEWLAKREYKDLIMVTAFSPQPVCEAIEERMTKLCREDAEVGPSLQGVPIELSFNGKPGKTV